MELLTLKREEGAMGQGMQVAWITWKRKGFSPAASRGIAALHTPSFELSETHLDFGL